MFGILKKKLSSVVEKFKKKEEEKIEEEVETAPKVKERKKPKERPVPKEKKEVKAGLFRRITKRVTEKEIKIKDVDDFLEDLKMALLENDVALEVADRIGEEVGKELAGRKVKRGRIGEEVKTALRKAILDVLSQEPIDLAKLKDKSVVVFVGFNGCGKTTTIAKIAHFLKKRKRRPVLAAADTFRSAAIEQLEIHAKKLGVKIIKHNYGSDAAAVVFDARKHVDAHGGIVLADTAGRSHANVDLMNEIEKVIRVNRPDLKILVVDSLTGNDAVEQARAFNDSVDVDAIILTKADVNEKGGAALSVGYVIGKPILFLGTGQGYDDLQVFDPEKVVDSII